MFDAVEGLPVTVVVQSEFNESHLELHCLFTFN